MSDELSAALRELAAAEATPPVVDGAGIRARATRRGRRRRVAISLGAGTAALVVLGLAVNLNPGGSPDHPPGSRVPPATHAGSTPPATATPTPVSGVLDLRGRTLALGGRELPVVSDFAAPLESTGPLTVVAKQNPRELTFAVPSKGSAAVSVPYVVELRDEADRPHYVGLFVSRLKALSDYDVRGGLIAFGTEKDAQWFYDRVRIGDTFSVTTAARAPDVTPSVPRDTR
ncbi:hypothetical protein IM697_00180 [Streptomyces ferrugineus]|uniref:Uncharacterized protein n=1 Tax=Streptomyces ferrugineus TaxID=1413221 RepID=A0A7M2SKP8_9ACTN|nr:hypothetical protein [Streptomyces ferrugineus]QOV36937.1 hypothetical protein IM697_00180 [Streptomyces ferrugineus]